MEELKLDLHGDQRARLAKEMYLKAIHRLGEQQDVRPVDLVNCLEVRKSTVSEMVKNLVKDGFITYESHSAIQLTPEGKRRAELVIRKYDIIKEFLETRLNMQDAHDEACHLEHAFSLDAVERLEKYMKKS